MLPSPSMHAGPSGPFGLLPLNLCNAAHASPFGLLPWMTLGGLGALTSILNLCKRQQEGFSHEHCSSGIFGEIEMFKTGSFIQHANIVG